MIRRNGSCRLEEVPHMREGKGTVLVQHMLEPEDFAQRGRLFAVNTLKPGCSIGDHRHVGDFEVYAITSGQGQFNDNGTITQIQAGDICITRDGEVHGIENTGTEDLVFTALIVFTKQ